METHPQLLVPHQYPGHYLQSTSHFVACMQTTNQAEALDDMNHTETHGETRQDARSRTDTHHYVMKANDAEPND
ncbi:hypothetical protein EYF80_057035 [Liparis tanakae]|uniref:Uncharacterized protein n=1 Tax=Liparis tanakae TaxID=230148 RepID=A0A4Z2EX24_9TELE|nr:hypothetical protein EYF80_057035 [Liparis tanakae]